VIMTLYFDLTFSNLSMVFLWENSLHEFNNRVELSRVYAYGQEGDAER